MRRLLVAAALLWAVALPLQAGEIDFIEDFSLAPDRTVPLKQLIPGTEDYYYYHALHYLNTEQYEKVRELMPPWIERHKRTPRVVEIETRHALLTYGQSPQAALDYLRQRLNLQFNHQKEVLGAVPNLPVALDPKVIARDTLLQQVYARTGNLDGTEDSALDWLVGQPLTPDRRRHLLSRLTRPDYTGLPKLIVDDLNHPNSPGFGAYGIHRLLLLPQLEELLQLKPDLLNQGAFVQTYLTKLQPAPDEDWRNNVALREAHLDRLWKFATRLAPVHNSLKVHVLYHRLVSDRSRGVYDRERLLTYLKLPRPAPYMARPFLELEESRRHMADLNADYTAGTLLPPVGNDEPLVRSYLAHFFVDEPGYKDFEPYVNDVYLKHLFAETKIVHGLGEPEQWASQLPPEIFRALKDRVDIDFAHTNKTQFAVDEPVKLDVHVKNVSTLIVNVFEINTENYYRQQLREVDTDINLDGLVANFEQTQTYADPALRRVARKFEFPQLVNPGVYVIDFIGNGRSSRALIRKGRLQQVVRTTPVGQRFTVLDEQNRKVPDARIWVAGHEYTPEKDGSIMVPFSTAPGRRQIVLSRGSLSTLDVFQHEAENYGLAAGIHVDRESLLTRKKAQVVIRPSLYINGTPISVKQLEDVRLLITSIDHDKVSTSQEVPDLTLYEDRESVHEFQVPARLSRLEFVLRAKVQNNSQGKKTDLTASAAFDLNQIEQTEKVEDLHLVKFGDQYVVELLGRTGEPKGARAVQFQFKHRDFQQPAYATLKTDPRGRIVLGALPEIVSIKANGPEGTEENWPLRPDAHTYARTVHGKAGQIVTLPYLGSAAQPARDELSLLELRGETFVADRFAALSIKNGLLQLSGLTPGDYDLWLKKLNHRIRVRIVDGPVEGRYVLGSLRQLETPGLPAVQIESIQPAAEELSVQLRNTTKVTRVHVFATRFVPAYDAYANLSVGRDAEPYMFLPGRADSVYVTGRNIGDEYRYIIDRRYAKKFPGNTLERPSLLLNPWAVRSTETGQVVAAGGDAFGARGAAKEALSERGAAAADAGGGLRSFANLDFLSSASALVLNLTADETGVVKIPRKLLGDHQHLHIVALDPLNATYRSISLAEPETTFIDLRLAAGLDPKGHFTQQKQISVVGLNQPFVLADITTSRFEAYDSLARVYALYTTLSKDPKLAEFSFILNWPKLKLEEKQAQYSKYASHELSFFLAKKDPEFFQQVVRPYLANKKDKTFVDLWLLGADLTEFTRPWKHAQLNVMERILLAQRLAAERPNEARHVSDLFDLLPPNIDQFIRLFDTGVMGSALETSDRLGIHGAFNKELQAAQLKLAEMPRPGEPAPSPALLAGGMPGAAAAPGMANKGGAGGGPGGPPAGLRSATRDEMERRKSMADRADSLELAKKAAPARDGRTWAARQAGDKARADDAAGERAEKEQLFFDFDQDAKALKRSLYRKLDPTMEWAENNYHHLTIEQQIADLVSVNAFWRDYAKHDPAQPFQSRNFAEAARNFSEMMFALAVLDLPFTPAKHDSKFEARRMTFTPGNATVVFHEEIKPAKAAGVPVPILVSQNFFKHGDRHRQENGEQVDKYVSEEFLIHTVYGCQVVVTNPTSSRQKLSVLLQVPLGAIPVLNSQATKTVHMTLEPYHTQTLEYHFYFPGAGQYAHYPVHVAKNEEMVAAAAPFVFSVVDRPTKIDTQSWDYVSQNGTSEEVIAFLNKANINQLNLEKIAFRMRDAAFFQAVTNLLAQRRVYHPTLWSYGILHNQAPAIREYLQHVDQIVNECGGRLVSPLLTIDPVARRSYEHLEYKPLVNARTHALGKRRQIVNDRLNGQYHRFMKQLSYQRTLSDDDLLAVTYYLLLQDRVEESLATFARVNVERVATKMQYDYCAAYLDFYSEDLKGARAIAEKYAKHPVDRWRNTFAAIVAQLDEAEGKAATTVDAEDRTQQQAKLAATEPSFEFQVEAKQLAINYQNLASLRVNYYVMDVELLFSRNPFVQQFSGQFSAIRPNQSQELKLPEKQTSLKAPLPESLQNKNVLIEITGAGQTKTQAYYSNSLNVQVIENYGQVKVTHATTGKPVPKAYVKVYSRTANGEVKFYKDGYTDIRGRFEYASLSTNDLETAARFSILILSEEFGATVREAAPPAR